MIEPRIRYARTSDDVNIAYATYGEGPPLVIPPNLTGTHLQLELEMPEIRPFYEGLARRLQVIRYDCRGLGMSQRDQFDFSIEAAQRDLAAVVDSLGLRRFALYNHILAGDGPLSFVANNPERITALLYWVGQTIAISPEARRQHDTIEALAHDEWGLYTNISSRLLFGWDSEFASSYAAMLRAGSSPEVRLRGMEAGRRRGYELLGHIHVPVLIAHVTGLEVPTNRARKLASALPSASVLSVPGRPGQLLPFAYDNEQLIGAVIDFVQANARGATSSVLPPGSVPTGTAVILFADIADSTALTERLGDAAFREKARDLDGALRTVIRDNAGTAIEGKLLGDGVLAVFTSARQAIEAALACGRAGDDANLPLHLGLHAGDVIREEDPDGRSNVYGGAVNIAARISGLSAPGEVLVSDTVRSLARTSAGVRFEDRGEQSLKGVGEPVRVWAILRRAQDERVTE